MDEDVTAPVEYVPLTAFAPLQSPDAMQLVASVVFHDSVEDPPDPTTPGLAEMETVGAVEVTPTLAEAAVVPPPPVQLSMNVDEAANAPVDAVPLTGFDPLQSPDAVQLVAPVELQVSVDEPPEVTVPGLAEMETVGALGCVTVTAAEACDVPPAPVHESAKVVVPVSAPVEAVPLTALAPVQPPEAVQLEAFVELHVRVEEPPEVTVPGLAEIDTVGAGGLTVTVVDC